MSEKNIFEKNEKIFKGQFFICDTCGSDFPMANPLMANHILRCLVQEHKVRFVHIKLRGNDKP